MNGVLLPCRIETLTAELLRATAEIARERHALVRLHCLQGALERELLQRWHGLTPLQLLKQTGLLDERLLIPHGIFVDRNPLVDGADLGDLQTLAEANISIIHCPLTSFRYGMALDSFAAFREAGINLCLGTDSFPPDLIRGMDTGVHLAKLLATGRTRLQRSTTLKRQPLEAPAPWTARTWGSWKWEPRPTLLRSLLTTSGTESWTIRFEPSCSTEQHGRPLIPSSQGASSCATASSRALISRG